jgi:DNA processing protein
VDVLVKGASPPQLSATTEQAREHAAVVALLRFRPDKLTWPEITTAVVEVGSALAVWERHVPAIRIGGAEAEALQAAAADIELWGSQKHTFITILDEDYPTRLRGIPEAPPVLFARGALRRDDPAVSVVGSREASERGVSIARSVATSLAQEGVTVLAGLALGIDTAAHLAALAAGGRTVAVIGTGINKIYPAANRDLHKVMAKEGLLLSQFWPDAPPRKHTFLMRNATMSGYGIATVLVEAGEHSGARAQARMAVARGRPVILTDLVVERNDWARALVGRPSVYVATALEDVMTVVGEIIAERSALDAQLHSLLSA